MAREGIGTILACALMATVVTTGWVVTGTLALALLSGVFWLGVGIVAYFFRDPPRRPPQGEGLVLSPADGVVVDVRTEEAREFLAGQVWRVAIFLSLFDVHVIRAPIGGGISHFRYQRGRFTPARGAEAGKRNEQVVMGIQGEHTQVLLQLIAGVVARRVLCHPREGWRVARGQKIGVIRFGSRVELSVPSTATMCVRVGQKVRAGETVVARVDHE